MGLLEKRRARKFFIYVQDYEDNEPKSHEGLDLNKVTARELIAYASLPYFYLARKITVVYLDINMKPAWHCPLSCLGSRMLLRLVILLHETCKYDSFPDFGFP